MSGAGGGAATRGPGGRLDLSIVVAATAFGPALVPCLEALARECAGEAGVEIVVAGAGAPVPDPRATCPGAVVVALPPGTPLARVRGAAVGRATGAAIATLTPAGLIAPGWLAAARAGSDGHAVVGGAVEPLATGWDVRAWAMYWCEYGPYLPPLPAGPAADLTGNNVIYRREALAGDADVPEGGEFWKGTAHRHLRERGVPLWADPALVVRQTVAGPFGPFLTRRFAHGRCYMAGRLRDEPNYRPRAILAAPFLPGLFLARLYRAAWPRGRYRRELLLATPLLWALWCCWALGELAGALAGAGESCARAF